MAVTFQFKRGKSSTFVKKNLILKEGEPGFELDTLKLKIGDGKTAWNDLKYVNEDVIMVGDNNSIVINDTVISLNGFEGAQAGQSIRKNSNGQLEWYNPVTQEQVISLANSINQMYTKEEVDKMFSELFNGSPEHLDTIKEITEWITSDTLKMIEMQNKVNSIESGAQVNAIEKVQVGDSIMTIIDKTITIPLASATAYGVVKSSDGINKVSVDGDGTMEVNFISVGKLRNDNCDLILRGGNAQI